MRFAILLAAAATALFGQNESWKRPHPGFKIVGNLYYVGTEDLACYLLTTPEGHILINTGLLESTPLIRKNMADLGFKLEDIKILLNMQAHYDHVAAMAEIAKLSGAKVYATEADAPVLEDGGRSDPHLGQEGWFPPVKVDRRLKNNDTVRLGGTELRVVLTPGHTKGSVSYTYTTTAGGRKYNVGIVNMNTVVMPLVNNAKYPGIADDYVRAFAAQKKLTPDIWLAAHGSQFGMKEKYKPGAGPEAFVDPEGYKRAIERYEEGYRKQLAEARSQTK